MKIFHLIFTLSFLTATFINASPSTTTVLASGMKAPEGAFWLTTELLGVTFVPGCLTTKYCVKPTFKVSQTLLNVPEAPSPTMTWPIDENLTKDDREHTFVTYWTSSDPKFVSFKVEVSGSDPTFGFSRVCDQTPETKVFQPDNVYLRQTMALRARRHSGGYDKIPAQVENSPIEFTLVGQCFNATFAVRKHLERCPWCPDQNLHVSLSNSVEPENESIDLASPFLAKNGLLYSIIILFASFLITVIGVAACLCIYCCSKNKRKDSLNRTKSDRSINRNLYHQQRALPPNHFHPAMMHQTLLKNRYEDDDHHYTLPMPPSDTLEHRYEAPWDRKSRHPIQQYWNTSSISHESKMMVISPVESSSGIGSISTDRSTIGGGNSGGSLPGVSHYHSGSAIINGPTTTTHGMINSDGTIRIPPNLPLIPCPNSNHHDDSGHDSV